MNNDELEVKTDLSKLSVHILTKVLHPIGWSIDIEKSKLVPNMDLDDFEKYLFDECIKAKNFFSNQAQVGKYDNLKIILIDLESQSEEVAAAAPGILWPIITEDNLEIDLEFHPYLGRQYLKLKAYFLKSLIEYLHKLLNIKGEATKKTNDKSGLTHREEAIFYNYKVAAKIEPYLTTKEIKINWNKNREIAFNSLKWPSKPTYKAPKRDELLNVKQVANQSGFDEIAKAIENDLDKPEFN